MATVVVGLSGGVDSSVAAYLLKKHGHDVIGVFMKNWHDTSVTISDECPWIDDSNDAMMVANLLEIPFINLDLSDEYRKRIVDYMFAEYEKGRTPNPDVLCNREIKFDVFLEAAKKLGAEFVATGHYCQKTETIDEKNKIVFNLIAGADINKDQSYFLCQINQEQLKHALFPIGHLQKSEVRKIAEEIGLPTAQKKDSQGLCFVGKIKLPIFLQQQLKPQKGDIIEIDNQEWVWNTDLINQTSNYDFSFFKQKKIGEHNGAHFYTIGQRKGLDVGGTNLPLYVVATDTKTNTVYVGLGDKHFALFRKGLFIPTQDVHWVNPNFELKIEEDSNDFEVRIRYRQPLVKCQLIMKENGLYIIFDNPVKAVAPGQFAAWYFKNELVGSGVIA